MKRVIAIDSHTEGEPTRVVVEGGPDLGGGTVAAQREVFRRRFDHVRRAIVREPRGSDFLVGALLVPPAHADAVAGVIFFNNVGFLNGCGHGTIGVAVTLAHLGRIGTGWHAIETPAGLVSFELVGDGSVRLENVPARRTVKDLVLHVPGIGPVVGDVAWGGNWFFLVAEHEQTLSIDRIEALVEYAWAVRCALRDQGVRGDDGGEIDHVELFGPPLRSGADSRNFVLCPGKAYDRSPCGTGTSAKLACLYADGKLAPGRPWRQESIIGSVFEGSVRVEDGRVIPSIAGRAFVTAETTLLFDERDPFRYGIDPGPEPTTGDASSNPGVAEAGKA